MSPFAGKVGHKIDVSTMSLDDLIEQFALRPPDFIKMDIEGGEVVAVPGMRRTLARFKPTLLIELHGRASARPALAAFEGLDYRFQVAGERTFDGPEAVCSSGFAEACLQMSAIPGSFRREAPQSQLTRPSRGHRYRYRHFHAVSGYVAAQFR